MSGSRIPSADNQNKKTVKRSGHPQLTRITLKRSTPIEEKRNDEETCHKRKDFILSLQPEGILYNHNCIFIDEAGFNINMIKGHTRSKAGAPAFVKTKIKRATNVTILFALSAEGVESCHAKIVKGGTTVSMKY
ncbi:hypothetical protein PHYBLDRAFT_68706 [Phycomyces blakesleeanus NRRL 1555(-)]|uniref:Tc1-like transposase DDE domain-containing protein n=1 Tax=Phycomyces blakesleeanus (strain ATCC 8743b / DSM 1359 / FGSC 10004 / NBRC 33097 / NRRL 1555) TaxID=763407 RepID=A0A167M7C0_PHYB8|nr:hypothetical protein PHYBLDRAFT_68706 [Phycomyces blakesleeanus NRRL 1555(-)]OAD72017.1 hypothetical protein PHYBLDRAFT_68706 [Phycomyces blakesleeanus NRRL 1555(-)]|eukprot:XP_018290057.1 hypothetical protein PHYBLDRAFT_68706 [Phycomyces blakesleeanus NRRL 1555(-)]